MFGGNSKADNSVARSRRAVGVVLSLITTALAAAIAEVPSPAGAALDQAPQTTVYSETFTAAGTGGLPAGWVGATGNVATPGVDWQVVASTPGTAPQGISTDHTQNGTPRFLGHDDAAGNDQKQVLSPVIDLTGRTQPYLEFWLQSYLQSGNSTYNTSRFAIVATDATGATVLGTLFEMGDTDLASWLKYTVRLQAYAGQQIRLRFDYDGVRNSTTHDIGVDDIRVFDTATVSDPPITDPIALTFFNTVPEDHVQRFHRSIQRAGLTCQNNETAFDAAADPVTAITSITVADDNAVIIYDQWEDGYGPLNQRTQWSTEVWGDADPTNGFPPGIPADVLNAGSVITLRNPIDPDTLGTVLDYDGGDRISSPAALVITRLGWSDGSSTLMAGATEVYDLSYYGTRYVIPVGTNSPVDTGLPGSAAGGQLFQNTSASITASRNNTVVSLPASVGGGTVTLQMGQSYMTAGTLLDGDVITANQPITVSLLAGDVCSNYETDWFTLLPTRLWDNEYYTPVFTSDSVGVPSSVHLYNPKTTAMTVSYRFGSGAVQTVSVPAQAAVSVPTPQGAATTGLVGYFFTPNQADVFYAIQSYDTGNSARDWGYGLLPADQLSPTLQAGFAPGADPTIINPSPANVSPLWVGAVWRGAGAAPASVTICIDWNGDANPGTYDQTVTLSNLATTKLKDPDNDNTAARIFVCNPANPTDPALADWTLVGAWGQESSAPGGSPSIDVGTGILNLPEFTMKKSVSRVADDNGNGITDLGDTIEYDLVVTNTSAVFVRANTLQVIDNPPATFLRYVAGSTKRSALYPIGTTPPAATTAVADDVVGPSATTAYPLDDPDTTPYPPLAAADYSNDGVDDGFYIPLIITGRTSMHFTFQERILSAPANNVIVNHSCVTDGRKNRCSSVGVPLPEFGSIGDRVWLDEDGDGVQDAGETGVPGVTVTLTPPAGVDLGNGPGQPITTITDANGGYLFRDLPLGTYTVSITPPAGMNATFDADGGLNNTTSVTLSPPAGGATISEVSNVDFGLNWVPPANTDGNTGVGALGDRVWVDADGDGLQDPGEAGLAGLTVTLYGDPDGDGVYDTVVGTRTTDSSGRYVFDDLPVGAYVVAITPPVGYAQTGDPDGVLDHQSTPIVLSPGDVYVNADFGYKPTAPAKSNSIGDKVWLDGNGNGVVDTGEPGLAGVTVTLLDSSGKVVATTTTDSSGTYTFTGLPDGTYTVWVNDAGNVLREYKPISNPAGDAVLDAKTTVNVSGGQSLTTADIGWAPPNQDPAEGLIGDTVFLDRDGDGTFDPGEGLEGVRIELFDESGRLVGVTYTNEDGKYAFGDVPAGNYYVDVIEATLPAGVTLVVDPDGGDPGGSNVSLGANEQNHAQDFGYRAAQPATVGGTIWNDANANGVLDPAEAGRIAGVTVVLRDAKGNVIATTTTDAAGNYSFPGLPSGTYTVAVTDDANLLDGMWHSAGPNPTADNNSHTDPFTVTLTAGQTNTTVDFGYNESPASVGNLVWQDLNGDGVRQGGEPGIAGVKVTLTITYPNGTVLTVVTTTAADGTYRFDNLLLDENFDGAGTGEPTFSIKVAAPANPALANMVSTHDAAPDPTGLGAGLDDNADNPAGESAFPAENVSDLTNDFGFRFIPGIAIVKSTNGADANNAPGPLVVIGGAVTWTYKATNTGFAPLDTVKVVDDNGTPANTADDITATYTTGDTGADNILGPGETWTFTATGTATAGQYKNIGTASAKDAAGVTVTATDPSNYFGVDTRIAVDKKPDAQTVAFNATAPFTIKVTNPGNVGLSGVVVSDPRCTTALTGPLAGEDTAPIGVLNPNNTETWTFSCSTANVTASFSNTATVTGTPVDASGIAIPGVTKPTATDTATVTVTPDVRIAKTVIGVTPLGGYEYEVAYDVTVTNAGPATTYNLTDKLTYGTGVTITSASATATGGGVVAAGWNGTSSLTLATAVPIAMSPTVHVYRVIARATVNPLTTTAESGNCTIASPETGTGFRNTASLSFATTTTPAEACAPVPPAKLAVTKAVTSGPTLDTASGTYTMQYTINVVNGGDGPGVYALTDAFNFGTGVTVIGTPTIANTLPGTLAVNSAWTGAAPNTGVVSNQSIAGGVTHSFVVNARVDTIAVPGAAAADCDTATSGPGTGLLNRATLNDGVTVKTADACAVVPLANVTIAKTVVGTPVRNADGTFTVTYQIDVRNGSTGPGRYALTDVPNFGGGTTIVGTPTVVEGATARPWPNIATNRLILPNAAHTFTVTVTASVSSTATPAQRDCDAATSGPGTGFLNTATLTVNGVTTPASACIPVPSPNVTIAKNYLSSTIDGAGNYTAKYEVIVKNVGTGPGSYTLTDLTTFGAGATITSSVVAGSSVNPAGTIATNAGWTGLSPNTAVSGPLAIQPAQTDTYTMTIKGSLAGITTATAADCTLDPGETGTGLRNTATIVVDGVPSTDDACDPTPQPKIAVAKSVLAGPTLRADGNYDISYRITVTNTGGIGSYSLTDSLLFGTGLSIVGTPIAVNTNPGTIAVNAAFNGTTTPTIVTGQSIVAGGSHSYTVSTVVSAAALASVAEGNCTPGTPAPNDGLFNRASITVGATTSNADACANVPSPNLTMKKTLLGGPSFNSSTNRYEIRYTVTVTNSGDGPGKYTLVDAPSFGDGVTVASGSMTNGAGFNTTAWNGTTTTTAVTNGVILGQRSHTYTVAIIADAINLTGPTEAGCDPAVGGATRGFLNTAALTSVAGTVNADACAPIPPSQITFTKGLDADNPLVETAPNQFTVTYLLNVVNAGQGPGRYNLVDELKFGAGITVNTVSKAAVTSVTPSLSSNASWAGWNGTSATTMLTAQPIAALTTQTVRIVVTVTLAPSASVAARDCDPAAEADGRTGLLNVAGVTPAGGAAIAEDACAPLPDPKLTVVKALVGSPVRQANGNYVTTYDVTVTNTGDGPGVYDLADSPQFPAGVTIVSRSVTANGAGTPTPLATWNGAAQPNVVTAQPINKATAHVYRIVIEATVGGSTPVAARPCAAAGTGAPGGFLNVATLTWSATTAKSDACAPVPNPKLSMTKTLTTGPTLLGNGNYSLTYTVKVDNATDGGPGQYTLADTLRYGTGVTVVSAAMTNDVVPTVNTSAWTGSGSAAANVVIGTGATHTYTVAVEASVAPTIAITERDCVRTTATGASGFLNDATMTTNSVSTTATACGEVPLPKLTLTKQVVGTPTVVAPGVFRVTYELGIEDVGNGPTVYDLADTFAFGAGVTVVPGSAKVTALPSAIVPNAAFDGATDPVIVTAQPIVPGARHRYTVVVDVATDTLAVATAADCTLSGAETGTGLRNTATLTVSGGPQDATACAPVPIADLSLVKSFVDVNGGVLTVGDVVEYRLDVSNAGPDTATNVVIADVLPAGLRYAAGTITGGDSRSDGGAPSLSWGVDALPSGTSQRFTYRAVVVFSTAVGAYTNAAQITSSDQPDPDSDPKQGFDKDDKGDGRADDDESTVTIVPKVADLSIVKTASNVAPAIGTVETYTLTVTNAGPDTATNVTISDVLPAGLVYQSASISGGDTRSAAAAPALTWTIDSLAKNASVTLTYAAKVKASFTADKTLDPAAYVNGAQITGTDQFDPDSDPKSGFGTDDRGDAAADDDETTAPVLPGVIGLAKTVVDVVDNPDGSHVVTYRLTVQNMGLVALGNLRITDNVAAQLAAANPSGFTAISETLVASPTWNGTAASNIVVDGQSLPVGGKGTVLIRVTLRPGAHLGPHDNIASTEAHTPTETPVTDDSTNGTDPDPNHDGTPDEKDPTPVKFDERPLLGLAKRVTAGPTSRTNGDYDITYEFVVRNYGNVAISKVQVTDDLRATFPGLTFSVASVTASGLTVNPAYNGTTNTRLLTGTDTLAWNATATITLKIVVNPAGRTGPFDNTALATGKSPSGKDVDDRSQNGADPDPDDNHNPGDNGDPTPVVFPTATGDVAIDKRVAKTKYARGEAVIWKLKVTNNGPDVAWNVVVVDTIPRGMVFLPDYSDRRCVLIAPGTVRCTIGTLAAGASVAFDLGTATVRTGRFDNVADVSTTSIDSNKGNNRDGASMEIIDVLPPTA